MFRIELIKEARKLNTLQQKVGILATAGMARLRRWGLFKG